MTIDQELQAALDVEPSPEFAARVRLRIASEPAPRRWRAWWLLPAAGAALAVVALAVVVSRPPAAPATEGVALLAARTPPPLLGPGAIGSGIVSPPGIVSAPPVQGQGLGRADVTAPSRAPTAAPEILIDPAEALALRRLISGPPLNVERPYVGPSLSALEIAPLSIEPLPTGGEGVRQ